MGHRKIKKARNHHRFKFINKRSLSEIFKMAEALRPLLDGSGRLGRKTTTISFGLEVTTECSQRAK